MLIRKVFKKKTKEQLTLTLKFTYDDPRDAEEAQYRLDRKFFFGKEIDVEFARGIRQSN